MCTYTKDGQDVRYLPQKIWDYLASNSWLSKDQFVKYRNSKKWWVPEALQDWLENSKQWYQEYENFDMSAITPLYFDGGMSPAMMTFYEEHYALVEGVAKAPEF